MSSFPLYDVLLSESKEKKELSLEEKRELKNLISNLDEKAQENIYEIIRMHSLRSKEKKGLFEIPYNGRKVNNDIEFNFDKLPKIVLVMMYKFAQKHFKAMEDEEIRELEK